MDEGPLTKEELDAETAEWREREALGYPQIEKPPRGGFSVQTKASNNTALIKSIMAGIAPFIHDLEKKIGALQTRIEELERKGYCGVWKSGKEYSPQSEVTHDGARWISHKRTSDKPGASADWTLTEKSEPTARSDTTTSPPRTNAPRPTGPRRTGPVRWRTLLWLLRPRERRARWPRDCPGRGSSHSSHFCGVRRGQESTPDRGRTQPRGHTGRRRPAMGGHDDPRARAPGDGYPAQSALCWAACLESIALHEGSINWAAGLESTPVRTGSFTMYPSYES
jgi:hypothetical protein